MSCNLWFQIVGMCRYLMKKWLFANDNISQYLSFVIWFICSLFPYPELSYFLKTHHLKYFLSISLLFLKEESSFFVYKMQYLNSRKEITFGESLLKMMRNPMSPAALAVTANVSLLVTPLRSNCDVFLHCFHSLQPAMWSVFPSPVSSRVELIFLFWFTSQLCRQPSLPLMEWWDVSMGLGNSCRKAVHSLSCSLSCWWCCEIPASHPCLLRLEVVVPRLSLGAEFRTCSWASCTAYKRDCNFFAV